MACMFWGLFFLFVDLPVPIGKGELNLLPLFAGCLLFWRGMAAAGSPALERSRPLALAGAVYGAAEWALGLMGFAAGWTGWCLKAGSKVFQLLLTRRLILGIRELEAARERDLGAALLDKLWKGMAAAAVAAYAFPLLPPVTWLGTVGGLLLSLTFLLCFGQSRIKYERGN